MFLETQFGKLCFRPIPEKLDFLLDVCPSAHTWLMLQGLPYQSTTDLVAEITGIYCLSLSSGGWKSTVTVSAGLVLVGGYFLPIFICSSFLGVSVS